LWKNNILINDEIKIQNIKKKDILLAIIIEIIIIIGFSIILIIKFDIIYKIILIIAEIFIIMIIGYLTKKQRLIKYFYGMRGAIIKFESKIFTIIFAPFSSKITYFYIIIIFLLFIIIFKNNLRK
jgi:hypothetical protein